MYLTAQADNKNNSLHVQAEHADCIRIVNGKPVLSNVVGIAKKSYNSLQLAVLINILVF